MTVPTLVAAGAWGNATTNPTNVPFPAGVQENDIAILIVSGTEGSVSGSDLDPAFTQFGAIGDGAGGSGMSMTHGWKRCVGDESETNASVDFSTGTVNKSFRILVYRGCIATGSPIEGLVTIFDPSVAETDITCPNVTTLGADRLLINTTARRSATDPNTNPPTGWSGDAIASGNSGTDHNLISKSAATAQEYTGAVLDYPSLTVGWVAAGFALIPAVSAPAAPTITDAEDEVFFNGETNVAIAWTSGGASQGSGLVRISPTDDINDAGAVEQTVTSWGASGGTITAVRGALPLATTCYLFVRNNAGDSNAAGYPVQFQPATATLVLTLVDENDAPLADLTGITVHVWRSGTIAGAPDQSLASQTANGSGVLSSSLQIGSLQSGDAIAYVLTRGSPADQFHAGRSVPDYA